MGSAGTERKFPLKQPPDYKAPVTRWKLHIPRDVDRLFALYVGVQSHDADLTATRRAEQALQDWLIDSEGQPAAIDTFRVTEGFDIVHSPVWVAYWVDAESYWRKIAQDLRQICLG